MSSADSRPHVPTPYQSDGGFTIAGLMLVTNAGVTTALVTGLVAGYIGQSFHIVILFPLLIGLVVGAAQVAVIDRSRVRNPFACGVVGFVAGLIAVIAMHFVNYMSFQEQVAEISMLSEYDNAVSASLETDEQREAFQAAVQLRDDELAASGIRNVDSFTSYLNWSAHQGVEFGSSHPNDESGLNIGYIGTYVYWAMEALIIAAVCVGVTWSRAAMPFCEGCNRWMDETELVTLTCDAKRVTKTIQKGDLGRLTSLFAAGKETVVCMHHCTQCKCNAVVIEAQEVTYHNGERDKKKGKRFVLDADGRRFLESFLFDCGDTNDQVTDRLQKQVAAMKDDVAQATNSASSNAAFRNAGTQPS